MRKMQVIRKQIAQKLQLVKKKPKKMKMLRTCLTSLLETWMMKKKKTKRSFSKRLLKLTVRHQQLKLQVRKLSRQRRLAKARKPRR